ncbi:coenzyme F420-dependent NADP oxidoreductase-like protein [Aquimarina sp. MAR_2010_214]|uniref:Rossmann-like and DUF2520 domain-containing protein n=1 Tax=Aquimarina sp. MAR_2010_214 TaxID=1250026 RepID=UPI000C6FCD36|nr:DUF2520 domain-containing protein [Aquimarina sp. MAR_2010_214]PKV50588.1 coenzyme F420-dependent NADP oxidoreductase-like protein [Aquimarina sp. MAR_2010_214]
MIRVIILGAGNVAKHLYTAFYDHKSVEVVQCYNRKGLRLHPNQKEITITQNINSLKEADVYILAVSDDAIEEVSNLLPFKNKFIVHTSGSVPMHILNSDNQRGVFYPLQTFSEDKAVDFTSVPFCLEAENAVSMNTLQKLSSMLSEKVYHISSEQRNVLHVSAVFVNNFANYLFSTGNDICNEYDVPFEILHPLIQETAQKITEMNPDLAQTGPAIRNDIKTIKRHLKILTNNTQKEIYKTLTRGIQSKYGKKL